MKQRVLQNFKQVLLRKLDVSWQELVGRLYFLFTVLKKKFKQRSKATPSYRRNQQLFGSGVYCNLQDLLALRELVKCRHFFLTKAQPQDLASQFKSPFRGQGLEFDSVRHYQQGDEARHIDWRLMARTGKPYVKLFHEEREQSVCFLVDQSASLFFATRQEFKSLKAIKISALFAWLAFVHNKKIGAVLFNEKHPQVLNCHLGEAGLFPLLFALVNIQKHAVSPLDSSSKQSSEPALLKQLQQFKHFVPHGSLSFIVSDFFCLCAENTQDLRRVFERRLFELARHSDVFLILIFDPFENTPLPEGNYRLSNGQASLNLHFSPLATRARHSQQFGDLLCYLDALVKRLGLRAFALATDQDLSAALDEIQKLGLGQHNFQDHLHASSTQTKK
ncbi:MAG TPA: DUF58 domain-containing protein [Pseudomonadales bacterium]|nr:DUF58 domain-containing protein [Pseudomonadales bacterium]